MPQEDFERERQIFLEAAQMAIPEIYRPERSYRWRGCVVIVILAALVLMTFLGGAFLSNRALPGSVFYGIKETGRELRLSWISDSQAQIQANLRMDQDRLQEIQGLIQQGRAAPVSFGGRIAQDEGGDWLVNDLKLRYDNDTQLVGEIWPGYYVHVEGVLQKDGVILAKRIQFQQFLVSGVVEVLTPERMVVDGLEILLAPDTLLLGEINTGSKVDVMALLADADLFRARLIKVRD
jgi:hypothetical protein